jgi:hypothetical protein
MTVVKNKILEKIEADKIEPTSKNYFEWIERVKWMAI